MKLEDQVITFEQAKRLHQLGVDSGSDCYWVYWVENDFNPDEYILEWYGSHGAGTYDECYNAYGVAELMRMIGMYSFSRRDTDGFMCGFALDVEKAYTGLLNEFPGAGLGNLLIVLLETKQMTPEAVNEKIKEKNT